MRKEFDMEEHQSARRIICTLCGRKWYPSLAGPCPEREERNVCMYCCRMCRHHYRGEVGQGCRVKDKKRKGGNRRGTPQGTAEEAVKRCPDVETRIGGRWEQAKNAIEPASDACITTR